MRVGTPAFGAACLALLLMLVPAAARANTGTPLMMAGVLHLAFLNLAIGWVEGALIARWFCLPRQRTVSAMVAANYFSMVAGVLLLVVADEALWAPYDGAELLAVAPRLILWLVAASYVVTIVLEWPFCWWALRIQRARLRSSVGASLLAQTASYSVLVPFYLLVSPTTLYRNATVERSLSFVRPPAATAVVYYIGNRDGDVWRAHPDGTGSQRVMQAGLADPECGLLLVPTSPNGSCELGATVPAATGTGRPDEIGLLASAGTGCVRPERTKGTWWAFGEPVDLRPSRAKRVQASTDFWAWSGLHVYGGGAPSYNLAMETPFLQWQWRCVTILPGDIAVAQLGYGREAMVVVVDLRARRVAALAAGHGPAVVLRGPDAAHSR